MMPQYLQSTCCVHLHSQRAGLRIILAVWLDIELFDTAVSYFTQGCLIIIITIIIVLALVVAVVVVVVVVVVVTVVVVVCRCVHSGSLAER